MMPQVIPLRWLTAVGMGLFRGIGLQNVWFLNQILHQV